MSLGRSTETHAKFIVSGEHAVLAGAPCLVYPLRHLRLKVEIAPSEKFRTYLNGTELKEDRATKVEAAAVLAGISVSEISHSTVRITTTIPVGSGLGSSAALCVALAQLSKKPEDVFASAHKAEGVFHGRSSGADPAGVMAQRPIIYSAAEGPKIQSFEAARNSPYVWVLLSSGAERETSQVISNFPDTNQESFLKELIEVSKLIPKLIHKGSWDKLPGALEEATRIHRQMGLVNDALDGVFARMRSEGAVATKLTGAGRGGFALGLYPLERAKVLGPKCEHLVVPILGND